MNAKSILKVFAFAVLLFAAYSPTNADAQTRKVRIRNQTDTDIRAKCFGFGQGVGFVLDVAQGQQQTEVGVLQGSRGILIWEDFNEKVIVTGSFELSGMNVIVTVTGMNGNYQLAYAATAGDI